MSGNNILKDNNRILGDNNHKSRFDPNLADEVNNAVEKESRRKSKQEFSKNNSPTSWYYELMPGDCVKYIEGVYELRNYVHHKSSYHPHMTFDIGTRMYLLLTFKENIQARVTMFNTDYNLDGSKRDHMQKLELFHAPLNSCTAICYKKESTLFKIVPESGTLILAPQYDNEKSQFYHVDYSIVNGTELDSRAGIYHLGLWKPDILVHPAWLAAVEDDRKLLKAYADIVFGLYPERDHGYKMRFNIKTNIQTDQLVPLGVNSANTAGGYSCAIGDGSLASKTKFVRVVTHGETG
jgi:hypothetical protein